MVTITGDDQNIQILNSHFRLHAITSIPAVFKTVGTSHLIFTFSRVLLAELFWVEPIVMHLYPL
jgi:hypothetical protein